MYLHKENRDLFHDAILLTSQKLEVSGDIALKSVSCDRSFFRGYCYYVCGVFG